MINSVLKVLNFANCNNFSFFYFSLGSGWLESKKELHKDPLYIHIFLLHSDLFCNYKMECILKWMKDSALVKGLTLMYPALLLNF